MLLQTALRVITAYTELRVPETADVEFLRKHALMSESDLPTDALANEIILRELERRKAAGQPWKSTQSERRRGREELDGMRNTALSRTWKCAAWLALSERLCRRSRTKNHFSWSRGAPAYIIWGMAKQKPAFGGLSMSSRELLEAALIGLERQRESITEKMRVLRARLGIRDRGQVASVADMVSPDGAVPPRKRRRMSAAARGRIAAAQRKRWAALKQGSTAKAAPAKAAPTKNAG
jgi:hypothetical protein